MKSKEKSVSVAGRERDELLLKLLRTPHRPRPKRERGTKPSIEACDERASAEKRGRSA